MSDYFFAAFTLSSILANAFMANLCPVIPPAIAPAKTPIALPIPGHIADPIKKPAVAPPLAPSIPPPVPIPFYFAFFLNYCLLIFPLLTLCQSQAVYAANKNAANEYVTGLNNIPPAIPAPPPANPA